MSRLEDLIRFYRAMQQLEEKLGGLRTLGECVGEQGWPIRGIYFFFENSESRTDSGVGGRVVRVGTHALKAGSKTTLWNRLSQHRGVKSSGGGNHRGSIFRLIVGQALLARSRQDIPTWGVGGSVSDAADRHFIDKEAVKNEEQPIERAVSKVIGAMPLLWLDLDDAPGPDSLRGHIERNTIALLSNYDKTPLDSPSSNWLGRSSNREKVQRSGLWNSNHVDETYDPTFLAVLEQRIEELA